MKYTLIMASKNYDGHAELDVREIDAVDDYDAARQALKINSGAYVSSCEATLIRGELTPTDAKEHRRAYDDHCDAERVARDRFNESLERKQYEALKAKFEGRNG